ncbi:MAG: hypothetical protein ACI4T1_00425 [Christensenellales bacterium]
MDNISKQFDNNYIHKLAQIEASLNADKREIINKINQIIEMSWKKAKNINDVYDFEIGAIKFEDYEWELLKNTKLKSVFESTYKGSYMYIMEKDFSKLLRGPLAYYYLVCSKNKSEPTKAKDATYWINNLTSFIKLLNETLPSIKTINDENKKFYLAICDHLRLLLILMLNLSISKINCGKNYFYNLPNKNDEMLNFSNYLINLHKLMNNTLFKNKIEINKLSNLINNVLNDCTYSTINLHLLDESIVRQAFKIHRELDCYIENYMAIMHCLIQFNKPINNYKFVGIMNGGIELPYILANLTNNSIDKISFINLNNNALYVARHNSKPDLPQVENINLNNYILLDDNALTGQTIQDAYNFLKREQNDVNIFLVRHPNINRIEQSKIYGHTINLDKYKKLIFGMAFDSPFSRLKPNTNWGNEYLDELEVFTKTGDAFLKCLYKNGLFKQNTEVSNIKGALKSSIWKESK